MFRFIKKTVQNVCKKMILAFVEFEDTMTQFKQKASEGCQYNGNSVECDLVQTLKEKQQQRRVLGEKIKSYDQYDLTKIQYLIYFLEKIKNQTTLIGRAYSRVMTVDEMLSRIGISDLERVVSTMSIEQIDCIASELKDIKCREISICELRSEISEVDKEIREIKIQLGIE